MGFWNSVHARSAGDAERRSFCRWQCSCTAQRNFVRNPTPLKSTWYDTIRYEMLFWHAIKSWHKLAYSTARKQKLKSGKRICSEVSANSPGNPWSQSWRSRGRLRSEGLAEKGSFKPGMKEWRGDGWWEWWVDGMEPMEEVPLKELGASELKRLVRGWRRVLWRFSPQYDYFTALCRGFGLCYTIVLVYKLYLLTYWLTCGL